MNYNNPLRLVAYSVVALVIVLISGACRTIDETQATLTVTATPGPATGPLPDLERVRYGGILTLANRGDPPAAFDTMRTSSIALHQVAGGLFGPGNLVMRCRENMYLVCPYLARSWVANETFTEWIFTIQNDVFWHDGTPFTAEDVKFWYELAAFGWESAEHSRAPAYFRTDLGDVSRVDVLSGNRVRISLNQPAPRLLDVIMNPRLKIAHPAHLMESRIKQGEVSIAPLDIGLVGTGPFKFAGYEKGSLVKLRRSDLYWERDGMAWSLPYLDGIDYVIITNPAAMDAAFRTGRLDGGARGEGHYLSVERREGYIRDLGDDVFYAEMQGGIFRLAFNVLKPGPWQDEHVRQAIALWIDKQAAIPSALGGFGYISPILGPSNPFTSGDFVNWPRFNQGSLDENRAEALRLLGDAGYGDGFSMGHLCRARTIPRCEFLQGQLAGLGIELKIQVVDEGEWSRARVSLDYDTQQGAHFTSPVPEGTESVFGVFSSNPDAYAKHDDEKVTALYDRLRTAFTRAQRVSIWRELERYLVLEQAYIVPMAGSLQVVPYRTYVNGLVIPPEDGHTSTDFATVWLDERL